MKAKPRRGSLVFPLVLIAAGVLLLLSNLGLIEGALWPDLLRFWPVLVIAVGLDLLLGRPSFGVAFGTLVFICLGLAVAGALFYALAPNAWTSAEHAVTYPLHDVSAAAISLSCERCAVAIDRPAVSGTLIEGAVSVFADARLHQMASAVTPDGISTYVLTTEPRFPFRIPSSRDELPWALQLAAELPLTVAVSTDGSATIDLRPFLVTAFDLAAGESPCEIWLPNRTDSTIHLSGSEIVVHVPSGVGVRVLGSPSEELKTSGEFLREGDELVSDTYDDAAIRALVIVRPNTFRLTIEPADHVPDAQSI